MRYDFLRCQIVPTDTEKQMLAKQTGFFTINQVNNSTISENMPHQTKNHELDLTSERAKEKERIYFHERDDTAEWAERE